MNNINELQNSKGILKALFAQRYLYSRAKKYEVAIFILIILNCLIANLFIIYMEEKYVLIFAIIILIASIILEKIKEKDFEKAAEIQEYIDRKIYGFDIKKHRIDKYSIDELEHIIKAINLRHKKIAELQQNFSGDSKEHGVKDWYVGINKNMKREVAIYKCQTQNTGWDKSNNDTYKKIKILFAVVILVLIIWAFKVSWYSFLIAILEPIISIINFAIKSKNFEDISKKIETLEDRIDIDNINVEDLEYIQDKIFERRKLGYAVHDFIDKIKSKELHEIYKEEQDGQK